jgi:peptide/nickel transport system permease protein
MRNYVMRRLLLIVPTLLIVTVTVFFSIRLIPGNVLDLMLAEHKSETINRAALEHDLGLDVPIYVQYGRWMGNIILHGDLGNSIWKKTPVVDDIATGLPITLELAVIALVVSLLIALPIGIYSPVRQDTVGDYIARSFAILCIAVPSFWLGTMVMVFPSIWWHWVPPLEYVPFIKDPVENLRMFVIPAFVLGMVLSGTTMRMIRTMMLEVLRQDYIRTAWSKGLRERVVVIRHALKNALIPVVTIIGVQIPMLIGGSVIIERIFVLPGIGNLMLWALSQRDYPIVSAINLIVAFFVLVTNLVVDMAYGYLDPRIHYT